MNKAIKLNYKHSLKTMQAQLKPHNEMVVVYGQDGRIVYEIREMNNDGNMLKTCGFFFTATDCAEYINTKNCIA